MIIYKRWNSFNVIEKKINFELNDELIKELIVVSRKFFSFV